MDFLQLSLIEKGGLLMWPLLVLSLLGFIYFIERALYLHRGQIRTDDFITGIRNLVRKRRLVEAITVCEETPGPVPGVVKAALLNYDQQESRLRGSIEAAAMVEIPLLERRIGSIAAIARIAPLLGLLGTVVGMVGAFFALQDEGAYAHIGVLAAGFGEALITTGTGLAIAIMAHLAHHFLHDRVRALVHDMEWAGHQIMQFLLHEMSEEEPETARTPASEAVKSNPEE